jgi:hypothetical protein
LHTPYATNLFYCYRYGAATPILHSQHEQGYTRCIEQLAVQLDMSSLCM